MSKVKEISSQIRGVSYKPVDLHDTLKDESVMLLRANNIDDDKINYVDVVYVDRTKVSSSQYLQVGDILVCTSSGSKNLVGKAALVKDNITATFGAFCKVVRPQDVFPDYLGYYFTSPIYRKTISQLSAGANINNIKNEHIDSLEIPLPPLSTQKQIAANLDKATQTIDLCNAILEKLDLLVKARFVEMFGEPELNQKNWKMNNFGDICTVRQGLQIPISKRLIEYEEDCYEYITVQYLHGGKSREYIKNPKPTVICNENDILMTRTGNTGMVVTGVNGVFHNNFFLIDFDRNKYNKDFLVQYLNLDIIQAEIIKRAGTSTIPDLNHGEFYKINVYEPPIELQVRFNELKEQIDKSKFAVQQVLAKAETLKKALMQEYFG